MADRKEKFEKALGDFVTQLGSYTTPDGQWTVKGFIDTFKNVYTISSDTKIVSKILEIHLFPQILKFAETNGYKIVPADHQNYYPDISFVAQDDHNIRFAVDFKTTYRLPTKPTYCNGFNVDFDNLSFSNLPGATSYFWDFGVDSLQSDTSRLFEPTYTYPDTGRYEVTLVVNGGNPCADTAKVDFYVYPS
jgi:hypothetical protein